MGLQGKQEEEGGRGGEKREEKEMRGEGGGWGEKDFKCILRFIEYIKANKSNSNYNFTFFQMELKIGRTFKLTKKLGSGAFGEIFHGINMKTNIEVAIKLEPINTKHPQLFYEAKLYQYLLSDSSVIDKGIPNVYYCATEGEVS